ncbi:hypothetical protein RQP46_006782 [Phenoliferia psychrophenolica]
MLVLPLALPLSLLLSIAPLAAFASPLFPTPPLDLDVDFESGPLHHYPNKVILARHGEKPPHRGVGLSKAGKKRAQCLRNVFGRGGKHDIGLIMAESYNHKTKMRARPFLTVKPLAHDLGIPVDTSCERDDAKCVRRVVKAFAEKSKQDVLICWKHSNLVMLQEALGGTATTPYPDDRFDIMWIMKHHKIISKESEKCKGIDDGRTIRYDPDLELDDEWQDDDEEGFGAEGDDVEDELDGDADATPAGNEEEDDESEAAIMDAGVEAATAGYDFATDAEEAAYLRELEQGQLILGN